MARHSSQRYWQVHHNLGPGGGNRRVVSENGLTLSDWMTGFCQSGNEAVSEVWAHDREGIGHTNILIFAMQTPQDASDILMAFAGAVAQLIEAGFVHDDMPDLHPAEKTPAPNGNTGLNETVPQPSAGWWVEQGRRLERAQIKQEGR